MAAEELVPKVAADAVLQPSEKLNEAEHAPVNGVDWNQNVDLDAIMRSMM